MAWKALERPGIPWKGLRHRAYRGPTAYKYSVPAHCRFCSREYSQSFTTAVDGTLVVPEFPLLVWLGNGLLEVPDVATLIFPVAVIVAAPSQTPQPQKRISY